MNDDMLREAYETLRRNGVEPCPGGRYVVVNQMGLGDEPTAEEWAYFNEVRQRPHSGLRNVPDEHIRMYPPRGNADGI